MPHGARMRAKLSPEVVACARSTMSMRLRIVGAKAVYIGSLRSGVRPADLPVSVDNTLLIIAASNVENADLDPYLRQVLFPPQSFASLMIHGSVFSIPIRTNKLLLMNGGSNWKLCQGVRLLVYPEVALVAELFCERIRPAPPPSPDPLCEATLITRYQ